MDKKQLFFSHTWKYDNKDRDNHERVKNISQLMKKHGWTVWLDEDEMIGNIDACMVNGIRNCECVIACLTVKYIDKINHASNNTSIRDNCFKEWTYSNSINKPIIPVIMESDVLTCEGKGILDMYFGNMLYLDLSGYITDNNVNKLNSMLLKLNYKPTYSNTVHSDKLKLIKNRLVFSLLRSTLKSNIEPLPDINPRNQRNSVQPTPPSVFDINPRLNNFRKKRYKSTPNFITL